MSRKKRLVIGIVLLCFASVLLPGKAFSPQAEKSLAAPPPNSDVQSKEVSPGPQNIKEKIGIYVFIAWLWGAIFVLIYFLKLKIIEADRLCLFRFFQHQDKEKP